MKGATIFFLFILLTTTGCKRQNQTADDLITVDVTKNSFPKKELILQDFMDVEYIPLETNDEFVNQGCVQAVGEKYILVKNYRNDGDIFVYDRNGKAIRKINRKGQGGEEYTSCRSVTLDEENNEMFINDFWTRKIKVYDLEGNFKRSIKQKQEGNTQFYWDIFNYDKENLICYDELNEEIPFLLVSKQDGSIIKAQLAAGRNNEQVTDGVESSLKTLATQLAGACQNVAVQAASAAAVTGAESAKATIAQQIEAVQENGYSLVTGSAALSKGTQSLADAVPTLTKGIKALNDATVKIVSGVDKLDDGSHTLADGMVEFDEKGISKIANSYNGDIKPLTDKLQAMLDAGEDYQTFTKVADGVNGSVKFIYKQDAIKADSENNK